MPSKKRLILKKKSNNRRAKGTTSDLLIKMEEGKVTPPKVQTPPPSVKFHSVRKTSPIHIREELSRPDGVYHNESKAALKEAESKMYKLTPTPSKLARIPTPEFFDHPPPEERERIRREASEELKKANEQMETQKRVEESRFVEPEKKRSLLNPFGWGNKKTHRKGKKSHRKGRKSHKKGKHSTRRK